MAKFWCILQGFWHKTSGYEIQTFHRGHTGASLSYACFQNFEDKTRQSRLLSRKILQLPLDMWTNRDLGCWVGCFFYVLLSKTFLVGLVNHVFHASSMTGANWYMELSPAVSLHCVNVGYLLIMNENNHYMSYFDEYLGLTTHACIVSLSFKSTFYNANASFCNRKVLKFQ